MEELAIYGIDLDDTCLDLTGALILFHNATYGTNLTREDFTSHKFHRIWGGTPEEALEKVEYFYTTQYFEEMKPIPGSVRAISLLAQKGRLEAITARPTTIKEKTEKQVRTHFGNNFDKILHSYNHFTKVQNDGTKLEICLRERVSTMVEDTLEYAMQFANIPTIRVLLFGDYPHNKNGSLPSNILRVKDWDGVLENN
jgi:uncharacterized HAD superfamily protein